MFDQVRSSITAVAQLTLATQYIC